MGSDIVAAARQYLGVRFHHQGRSTAGMDCAGLVVLAHADAGRPVVDAVGYGRNPYQLTLVRTLAQSFDRVLRPEPGDVLLMAFASEPQHLAIYTGRTIIHSYEKAGKVIEHRFAQVWQARVRGVYRVR